MRRYYSHYSLLLLSLFFAAANSERFRVIREWKYLNFTWPNADVYDNALSRGFYVPENNIISGIKFFEDYYYITLPRMKDGVPATLARIPAGPTDVTAPAFEPFPSWEMNTEGDCNAFQNVQNIEIDPKGQMWIIDSGRTETLTSPSSRCPPKLVIFDIKKNMTTTAYTFPDNVASLNSNFLYDIVVDDTDSGFAYITDNSAKDPGIIIFSVKDHHSWKIRHSESMRADPTATTFRVNGVIINSPLNLASISLSPRVLTTSEGKLVVDDDREVFYSPISSLKMYSINTTVLKNEQNGANNGEYQGNVNTIGIKGSQSAGMLMDNKGILYYTLLGTSSIAKWDIQTPFMSKQRIIARDEKYLQWPNSFTFDNNGNLTILVNQLNKFIYDRIDINHWNYRLISSHTGGESYIYSQAYDYDVQPKHNEETGGTSTSTPNPDVILEHKSEPAVSPEPTAEPIATIVPKPAPEPQAEPEPTAQPEPKAEPKPKAEPEPKAEPAPKAEPEPTAEPEPKAEPEPQAESTQTNQTVTTEENTKDKSSASTTVSTILGFVLACSLFVI